MAQACSHYRQAQQHLVAAGEALADGQYGLAQVAVDMARAEAELGMLAVAISGRHGDPVNPPGGALLPPHSPTGCDDCSVEPGERHRTADCPGALRASL